MINLFQSKERKELIEQTNKINWILEEIWWDLGKNIIQDPEKLKKTVLEKRMNDLLLNISTHFALQQWNMDTIVNFLEKKLDEEETKKIQEGIKNLEVAFADENIKNLDGEKIYDIAKVVRLALAKEDFVSVEKLLTIFLAGIKKEEEQFPENYEKNFSMWWMAFEASYQLIFEDIDRYLEVVDYWKEKPYPKENGIPSHYPETTKNILMKCRKIWPWNAIYNKKKS